MPRVNKIKRLPAELRDMVTKMLETGSTVTEVAAALDEAGATSPAPGSGATAWNGRRA